MPAAQEPFSLIDVHAHLAAVEFAQDLDETVERAARLGVSRIISVGTDLESSRRSVELAGRFPGRVYAAVGVHPNELDRAGPRDMEGLAELAGLEEVVAVGETGLDFYRDLVAAARQAEAFREHVRLALSLRKPLVVHARKSDEEVLRILTEEGAARGVRHCFEGSAELAVRYLELGFHVSLAASVTRPGYKRLKAAVRSLPADHLLVETDCPYQTPASRAGSRNEPAFIVENVRAIAALRGETAEAVAAATSANALELFWQMPDGDRPGAAP